MECEALKSQSGSATLLCLIGDGFIFYNAYASGLCQKNISSISALVVENGVQTKWPNQPGPENSAFDITPDLEIDSSTKWPEISFFLFPLPSFALLQFQKSKQRAASNSSGALSLSLTLSLSCLRLFLLSLSLSFLSRF